MGKKDDSKRFIDGGARLEDRFSFIKDLNGLLQENTLRFRRLYLSVQFQFYLFYDRLLAFTFIRH